MLCRYEDSIGKTIKFAQQRKYLIISKNEKNQLYSTLKKRIE